MDRPVRVMVSMGCPDLLINLSSPLTGLDKETPDRAGHNPATEQLGGADHRDHGLLAEQVSTPVYRPKTHSGELLSFPVSRGLGYGQNVYIKDALRVTY